MELLRPKLVIGSLKPLRQFLASWRGIACQGSYQTPGNPSYPFYSTRDYFLRSSSASNPSSPCQCSFSTEPCHHPHRADPDALDKRTRAMFSGLCSGDRGSLARAITLVETTNKEKAEMARKLMNLVTRHCRQRCREEGKDTLAFRVGLSGPPGAGKSTFIEALGKRLTQDGHRLAVLAVDPSSSTTGGSLLGDKTRMQELSRNAAAYIRPSPSRGHLGGVARNTNEAVVLCEAAGYNIVFVETVGVGQSEFLVSDMVDMFCLILSPAGGDELQGLKRGIVEQSDLIIVNKADGNLLPAARRTAYEYTSALKYMRPRSKIWRPKVKLCSSVTGEGLNVVWDHMEKFRQTVEKEIVERRAEQRRRWMWTYLTERIVRMVRNSDEVGLEAARLEEKVREDDVDPGAAADKIIQVFLEKSGKILK